jgi:hypothetical protein
VLTSLRAILRGAAKSLGVERAANAALIEEMWADVIGPEGAAHCRMAGLRGTVVLADAEAGPWAQELSARRGRIIVEINRRLGGGVVTEIRFRQTGRPLPPTPAPASPARPGREPEREAVGAGVVSPDELAAVERVVAEIGDAEIREGARRAMISQLKWRKGRMESDEHDPGEPG